MSNIILKFYNANFENPDYRGNFGPELHQNAKPAETELLLTTNAAWTANEYWVTREPRAAAQEETRVFAPALYFEGIGKYAIDITTYQFERALMNTRPGNNGIILVRLDEIQENNRALPEPKRPALKLTLNQCKSAIYNAKHDL